MSGNADAVSIARSWIGTPYVHQASRKGAGTDCLGLVRGVWRELIGPEPVVVPHYTPDWSEPQQQERLWQGAASHLVAKPKENLAQGDVLLFRMRSGAVAKHLGIVSVTGGSASFIHSYSGHGVTESCLSDPWQRRVVAAFEFPSGSY